VCKVFENNEEKVTKFFHCDDCGICRVGPKNDYFHCKNCGACLSISVKDTHKCIKDVFMNDCPVCYESIFYSNIVI